MHWVQFQTFRVYGVDKLLDSVKENPDIFFDLLVAHQVLEVAVRVITFFLKACLNGQIGLNNARSFRPRSLCYEFSVKFTQEIDFVVQHLHPIQAKNRVRVLLQNEQMIFRHDFALCDQEVFGEPVKALCRIAIYDLLHVFIIAADKSVVASPVLLA